MPTPSESFNNWSENPSRPAGTPRELTISGLLYEFRWIPAGEFLMGCPEDEGYDYERPRRKITLTRGFWLQSTPVTREMWESIMGSDPSEFNGNEGKDRPVENVSWNDCKHYLLKANDLKVAPKDWKFDLTTEAQWEYACRAGTNSPFWWGETLNGDMANCCGEEPYGTETPGPFVKETAPVRSYPPNPWGLYDTLRNVWEWCSDYYDMNYYKYGATVDPTGCGYRNSPDKYRVLRGGGWLDSAECCRSGCRAGLGPDESDPRIGFRLALVPAPGR